MGIGNGGLRGDGTAVQPAGAMHRQQDTGGGEDDGVGQYGAEEEET